MKKLTLATLILTIFVCSAYAVEVNIPDANLEAVIRDKLNKPVGPITDTDLESITELDSQHGRNTPDEEKIEDLTGLEYCTNLTELFLGFNQISDISALSHLTNLSVLSLYWNQISDISPLSNLTNLTYLRLNYGNHIADISALSNLTNLTSLSLGWNQISNISPLSNLTNLTWLYLGHNQISDISALSNLTNLPKLSLCYNQISNISPLSNLTNLTYLYLDHNQISDISALSNFTNLNQLRLGANPITDISALSNLTNLTWLNLGASQISDISALSNLTNLTWLWLHQNQISDISALSSLTNLGVLTLHDNQISDLSSLSGLTNLFELSLSDNQISNIAPLSSLTNLEGLVLSNNQITDISPLANLANLGTLFVDGNQITDISSLAELTEIGEFEGNVQVRNGVEVHLGLSENQISDITPLVNNPGIGEDDGIDLDENPLNVESLKTLVPELKAREVKVIGVSIIVPDIEALHALSLDGNGDYVKILDSDSLFTNNTFTVEAWFNIHRIESGRWNQVFANDEYEIAVDGSNNTIAVWDNAAGEFNGKINILESNWYHVAFVNDGTTRKIFLNGIVDSQNENSSPLNNVDRELWIGNDPQPSDRLFNGLIDEVRIWKVARTQEEIRATMTTMLQSNELGLVGYWNFDDGTARDLTAYGNHGTLHGDAGIMPIVDAWPPPQIGDTSGDGSISAYDASLILQYCVGLIDHLPANIPSIGENITPRNRTISIPNVSVKTNELISVPIIIDETDDLVGGGITIKYDTAVLRATGVKVTPDSLLNRSFWQSNINNDEIRFAFSKNYLNESNNSKTVAMLEFEAISSVEGITTDLVIEHAQIAESTSIAKLDGHITFLPSKTLLLQNYPNPFNPETWIPFKLSNDANVVISIYDISGQLVRKIGLGNTPAGMYLNKDKAVYWDGCNSSGERVSSGLYFYTLQAGSYSATKRMLILK